VYKRLLSFPVHLLLPDALMADELGCVSTVAFDAALNQERYLLRRAENKRWRTDRELLLGVKRNPISSY